jgi:hypothetical protein
MDEDDCKEWFIDWLHLISRINLYFTLAKPNILTRSDISFVKHVKE